MKIRKLIFGGAVLLATTALFSFKAESKFWQNGSIVNPTAPLFCQTFMLIDDDCAFLNTGERCTSWYSDTYPEEPAFVNQGAVGCQLAAYHRF